jgi:hypothetical protein
MKIEDHKKAKPRHTGKDVKTNYDLKRDRERTAAESVGMRTRVEAVAAAAGTPAKASATPRAASKRPRRLAAE